MKREPGALRVKIIRCMPRPSSSRNGGVRGASASCNQAAPRGRRASLVNAHLGGSERRIEDLMGTP